MPARMAFLIQERIQISCETRKITTPE
jgi:hypothetical protein